MYMGPFPKTHSMGALCIGMCGFAYISPRQLSF
uniref:Uncharacterized protein n=1 Tax=Rhizophora mucronata TaxID=61149 RepID=A0A2P2Q1C6_RHIMU